MFYPASDLEANYLAMSDGHARYTPSGGGRVVVFPVMFSTPTDTVLGGDAQSDQIQLRYLASTLVGARRGDSIIFGGAQYRLRKDPEKVLDGQELIMSVERI